MSTLLLHNLTLIDGTGRQPQSDVALLLHDGKIESVGAEAAVRPTAGVVEPIDLGGATVMPGLVNGTDYLTMKAVTQQYYDVYRQSSYLQLLRCVRSALVLLAQGVTTTVDIGAIDRVNVWLREGIHYGLVRGPRVITSGNPIEPRFETEGVKAPGMTVDAMDAAEVQEHAGRLIDAGADFITVKIDRLDFKSGRKRSFNVEEVRAAGDVAKAAGKWLHVLARDLAERTHGLSGTGRTPPCQSGFASRGGSQARPGD